MADFDIYLQERFGADDPPEPEPDDESWAYDYWVTDEIWAEAVAAYRRELSDR
jgi:hypothetical protein